MLWHTLVHTAVCGVQDDVLLAYQIAFDLVENELQSFIIKVRWYNKFQAPEELQMPCCVKSVDFVQSGRASFPKVMVQQRCVPTQQRV